MLRQMFLYDADAQVPVSQEGDLYKIVNVQGHSFPIYYGYYADCERENPEIDPMPIYPDFRKEPCYTAEGFAFVTKMQDACVHYEGNGIKERDCAECAYYQHGDELLGVCLCQKNRQLCTG